MAPEEAFLRSSIGTYLTGRKASEHPASSLNIPRSSTFRPVMRRGSPASLGSVTICSLEGKDDNDRPGLLQVLIPLRAIQSVVTSTSDYGAELVRATGGTIHVILNSGNNQIS